MDSRFPGKASQLKASARDSTKSKLASVVRRTPLGEGALVAPAKARPYFALRKRWGRTFMPPLRDRTCLETDFGTSKFLVNENGRMSDAKGGSCVGGRLRRRGLLLRRRR